PVRCKFLPSTGKWIGREAQCWRTLQDVPRRGYARSWQLLLRFRRLQGRWIFRSLRIPPAKGQEMESDTQTHKVVLKFPALFFDRIINDIPAVTWISILASNRSLKKEVLEGFSLQPAKFSRMISQPLIMSRLRRRLQTDAILFEKVLAEWKEEKSAVISYLAMLDDDFIAENYRKIRGLVGSERFCICLYALGFLNRQWATEAVRED